MEFDSLAKQEFVRGKQSVTSNLDYGVLSMVDDTDHRKADRRKADLALQKSEERCRAFVEHSSEAVWCLDIEPPCSINLSVEAQLNHFYEHGYLTECNQTKALHLKSIYQLRKSSQTSSQIPSSPKLLGDRERFCSLRTMNWSETWPHIFWNPAVCELAERVR